MTQQHPITPPPELVEKWASAFYGTTIAPEEAAIDIAHQAAELESAGVNGAGGWRHWTWSILDSCRSVHHPPRTGGPR
jgi:hypothetical protein